MIMFRKIACLGIGILILLSFALDFWKENMDVVCLIYEGYSFYH